MKRISMTKTDTDGFETLEFSNGQLAFAMIPALGGKISSLRALPQGREWLWRNPRLPYQRVAYGSSYVHTADTGGWDECFPTVASCDYPSTPWTGTAIQDHGELWSQEARTQVTEGKDAVVIASRWQGTRLPYEFERTITFPANSARLAMEYRVTNEGEAPVQWIWSAHPLLAIEPGMQLLVPPSARFYLGGSFPDDLVSPKSGLSFPLTAGNIDLTMLPRTDAGIAMKLWSEPLPEGWASLRARDGEFRMRWDATKLPQLGIWMNLGKWSGDGGTPYYNLGLEPCIGAQDSLAEAVTRYALFETLAPGGSRTWGVELEIVG